MDVTEYTRLDATIDPLTTVLEEAYKKVGKGRKSGIVTQTSKETFQKDVSDQKHEPMTFLGGKLSGEQANW